MPRTGPALAHLALALLAGTVGASPAPAASDAAVAADTPAFRAAQARRQDAETLAGLTAEARVLLERDRVRLNGYDYCNIAVAAAERGEFRTSIEAASRALLIGQTDGNADLVSVAKRDLALAYSYAGDLERASAYAGEALASKPANPSKVYAPAHKVLGDVALRQGNTQLAVTAYQQALQTAGANFRHLVLVSLANAYLAAGEPREARAALAEAGAPDSAVLRAIHRRMQGNLLLAEGSVRQAVEAFAQARDAAGTGNAEASYDRLWASEGLARALRAQGDTAGAMAAYLDALDAAEGIRARFRSDEFKTGTFANVQDVYDAAIELAAAQGDYAVAWEISERSRARALLDVVRERAGPEASRAAIAGQSLSLDQSRQGLRPGEALVQFHSIKDATLAWVIRADGYRGHTLPLPRADLALAVEDLREAIVRRRAAALDYAGRLHELLLAPLALREGETLIVVPHGALHYLPFQALRNDAGFLIERHAVTLAPSAAIGVGLASGARGAASELVAFGNPEIAPDYALPAAEREVRTIAPMFGRQQTFIGTQADRERFTRHASGGQVLHLATHAEADTVDPMHSRILLAPKPGTLAAPDLLIAQDIFGMRLQNVALVTLSACETGLGRIAAGDEILGFTRAFFYAGASSLVASLWPVSDDSSELLMTTFYQRLTDGESAAPAMRAAQRRVLAEPEYAHPFFWAPFNLMGDWRLVIGGQA